MIFTKDVLPESLRKDIEIAYPNQNLRVARVHEGTGHECRQVAHDNGVDLWVLVEDFGGWYNATAGHSVDRYAN